MVHEELFRLIIEPFKLLNHHHEKVYIKMWISNIKFHALDTLGYLLHGWKEIGLSL